MGDQDIHFCCPAIKSRLINAVLVYRLNQDYYTINFQKVKIAKVTIH